MKRLSVFILIAALCLVGWALPVGAEKIRLTDAEMDGITAGRAGVGLTIPPPALIGCCVHLMLNAVGGAMPPMGGLALDLWTKPGMPDPVPGVNIMLNATGMASMGHGNIGVAGTIMTPGGISVPVSFNLPF